MNRRMYRAGETITDPTEAMRRILAREYLIVHGKPTHPGWCSGWSVNLLAGFVRGGYVQVAVLTPRGEQIIAKRNTEEEQEIQS